MVGEQEQGSTAVDVQTVDGKVIREPGKPPWAGGWKRVGKDHPGWSQEKADRMAGEERRQEGALRRRLLAARPLQGRVRQTADAGATPTPAP